MALLRQEPRRLHMAGLARRPVGAPSVLFIRRFFFSHFFFFRVLPYLARAGTCGVLPLLWQRRPFRRDTKQTNKKHKLRCNKLHRVGDVGAREVYEYYSLVLPITPIGKLFFSFTIT